MSQTIIAVFTMLLSQVLPLIGVEIGSDQLTDVISTIVAIGAGLWIWYRRVRVGDVTAAGKKV